MAKKMSTSKTSGKKTPHAKASKSVRRAEPLIFSKEEKMITYKRPSWFKRIFIALVIAVVLALSIGYFFIYTPSGNYLLRPFVQARVESWNPNVKLKNFQLSLHHLEAQLEYNQMLDVRLSGNFSLFKRKMDLAIKGQTFSWQYPFEVSGRAYGDFENFILDLSSNVAKSKSRVIAQMTHYHLQRLYIDSKEVVLEEFLPLWLEDNAIGGLANFSFYGNARTEGSFELQLLSSKLLHKSFSLPFLNEFLKESASGRIKGRLSGDRIQSGSGRIASRVYRMDFENITGNFHQFSFNYQLKIPSLQAVHPMTRRDFPILISGSGGYDKQWRVALNTTDFGGSLTGEMVGHQIGLNFTRTNIAKLLAFLRLPQEVNGDLSGSFDYDLDVRAGRLASEVENFKMYQNKFFDLLQMYSDVSVSQENFKPFYFKLEVKDKNAMANFEIRGDHINVSSQNFSLNLDEMRMDVPLLVQIQNAMLNLRLSGSIETPDMTFDLREILRLNHAKE